MKAAIIISGSGPVLILTSYASCIDPQLVRKLAAKGIRKFIAFEIPLEIARERYGTHFPIVMGDLNQTDDLRVLDYDGHHIFHTFHFSEFGTPIMHE